MRRFLDLTPDGRVQVFTIWIWGSWPSGSKCPASSSGCIQFVDGAGYQWDHWNGTPYPIHTSHCGLWLKPFGPRKGTPNVPKLWTREVQGCHTPWLTVPADFTCSSCPKAAIRKVQVGSAVRFSKIAGVSWSWIHHLSKSSKFMAFRLTTLWACEGTQVSGTVKRHRRNSANWSAKHFVHLRSL